MAISNEELVEMVKRLPQSAKKPAYDYLKYLTISHTRPNWDEIMELEPDETPLSDEEEQQLKSNSEFVSCEEVISELNIPTDTKS
ncbi:XRE family transcriptional regulator [Oceanobacillus sp. Castelsardo]|uniref:XRE family transcriptional regulator n=1 Tax=Oceanobacillus sp. Castelsardo TaxID=1851204 RepID=UPI0008385C70|nr:XRE family transcriptional regulator [Oceanobacillus sp. Castelsardo]